MTRIAITGASGLVGRRLSQSLSADGHEVVPLARTPGPWGAAQLEGVDAVVHLAGEPVAGRWTRERKARIENSRVDGTSFLARTIAALARKPGVFVSVSAVGYYGCDRGDAVLDEESSAGTDFLARVCVAWESAAHGAGVRTVHPRFGVVLAREGGALAKMVTPFSLGAGGRIGSGEQWMSWIAIDDVVAVLRRTIDDEGLRGPVNAVAPGAVTNADFTKALAGALHRPAVATLPAFAVRLAFGEMGESMLLGGQRVAPRVLADAGFSFAHPTLDVALAHLLTK